MSGCAIQNDKALRFIEMTQNEAETMDVICQRVADGDSLTDICKDWNLPRSRVAAWIASGPNRKGAYETALALWADALVAQCVPIADEGCAEDQAHRKLRIDTRFKAAERAPSRGDE
jgi:hypothetical protein